MTSVIKHITLFSLIVLFHINVQSQYLCENEHKVIHKQKRKVKKKCKKIVYAWVIQHKDSLNLPKKLTFSRLKFKPEDKETHKETNYNMWYQIDSLLCITKDIEYIKEAKKKLLELQLVVFDIRSEFSFGDAENLEIKSVINFEFDIEGNLIRAVIRKKKNSPFSETPYH